MSNYWMPPPLPATGHRVQNISRPEECGVCFSPYDEQEHRPRTMPCGHTFCSKCISALLKNDSVSCPSCCAVHWASDVTVFPISYALEEMIRVMKASQTLADFQANRGTSKTVENASQSPPLSFQARGIDAKQKATVRLSTKMQALVNEQKVNMKSLEVALQQEQDQLHQYQAHLAGSLSEHGHIVEELNKYVQLHQATMNLLQEEYDKIEAFVEEGKKVQRELETSQSQLDLIKTAQEAINATATMDSSIAEVEIWLEQSKEEIPNGITLNTSCTILETTKAALETDTEDSEAPPLQIPSGHLDCTVMEAVKNAGGRIIKLVDLFRKELRKKMDTGQVFAALKNEQGQWYSSKMTYNEHKVYLHSLHHQLPPKSACIVEMNKTVQNLEYLSTLMFMDLSWANEQQQMSTQRIHIWLEADTPLCRKFVTLCLGVNGPTFCQTAMLREEQNGDIYGNFSGMLGKSTSCIMWGGNTNGHRTIDTFDRFVRCASNPYLSLKRGMLISWLDQAYDDQSMEFGVVIDHNRNGCGIGAFTQNNTICCLGHVVTTDLENFERAFENHKFPTQSYRVSDCGVVLRQ